MKQVPCIFLLFTLTLLAALCCAQEDDLLLVVGDVATDKARVLVESLTTAKKVYVSLFKSGDKTLVKSLQVDAITKPTVIQFDSLDENTDYFAEFESTNSGVKSTVTFSTYSNTSPKKMKLVVVSCDRSYEDEDETMWQQLLENEPDRFGMIHLGDQVYADRVAKEIIELKKNNTLPPFEELVEKFRRVYRKTWTNPTIRKVLRNGAHWMLPDDHDIINNLDKRSIDLSENPDAVPEMINAGRQAVYEYQIQLQRDIYQKDSNGELLPAEFMERDEIYFFKSMANVCWMFLDTRFQKTFQFDSSSAILGSRQIAAIKEALNTCAKDARIVTAFSSVPFLFMSETFAKIVYKVEKEKYSTHPDLQQDAINFLNLMGEFKKKHPKKDVKLVGGDIHQFFVSRICNISAIPVCIDQLATSGITKGSRIIQEMKLFLFYLLHSFQHTQVGSWELIRERNRPDLPLQGYLGANYGVITVDPSAAESRQLEFFRWKGVANKHRDTSEQVMIFIYDHIPEIKFALLALVLGLVVLAISMRGRCSSKESEYNRKKNQ